jgi:monovalent cation:H+ antiporter-2, CPA2 family
VFANLVSKPWRAGNRRARVAAAKISGAHLENILVQITIYLAAAVIIVPLSQKAGFGSVLGYLIAGLAIGPVLGLVGAETEELQEFAEYGVVLMLFLIGLEINPKTLWDMRMRLVGLGGAQVALTLGAVMAIGMALGLPWRQGAAVGIILCLSSTAIVMQTLNEKKLARSEGGRAAFSVLLFQDLAVIPLLAILPLLALGAPEAATAAPGHGALPVLTGWEKALLVVGIVVAVIMGGLFLTRPMFRYIALARLPEIQTAAALLLVVAISAALGLAGLSPALGSFLAGVVLANSEYRHELESDIAPFKGLLMGLFFITVGAGIDLELFAAEPLRLVALTLALMALKIAVLVPIAALFRLSAHARLLFALSLAQAGEFAFFLLAFARQTGVLPVAITQELLLIVSLSMFLTPLLFLLYERLRARLPSASVREADLIDDEGAVIIAGMGRFGQTVNRMLTSLGHKTVVLDSQPNVVDRLRAFGIKGFYGDIDRPELLAAAGVAKARVLVLAIDDPEKTLKMADYVHRRHPHVKIIARAHDRHHVYQLYAAGAPDSVREMFDSSIRAGKYALSALGHDDEEIERFAAAFFDHDRHMLAEMAEIWDPDIPLESNPAYVKRSREQAMEIEAALRGRMAQAAADTPGTPNTLATPQSARPASTAGRST